MQIGINGVDRRLLLNYDDIMMLNGELYTVYCWVGAQKIRFFIIILNKTKNTSIALFIAPSTLF